MTSPATETPDSARRIRSLTLELLYVYEELSLLYKLTADVSRLTSEDAIIGAALKEAMEVIPADYGCLVRWEGDVATTHACNRLNPGNVTSEAIAAVLQPHRVQQRNTVLIHDADEEAGNTGLKGRLLACALTGGSTPKAYLCLLRSGSEPIFTSVDQKLMAAITAVVGIAIENLRLHRSEVERIRLEGELALAHTIQQSLLPHDFRCRDFMEAFGASYACQQIGGDYYDLVPVNEDDCLCLIADVSGKGPGAALKAATIQGNVQALTRTRVDPVGLASALNECFRSRPTADTVSYVTAFAGILDRSGRLTYCNAGHNPPLLITSGGSVQQLSEGGPFLGFFKGPKFQEGGVQLSCGDVLLLYTDGVTECEDTGGEFFGIERLISWAVTAGSLSPDVLCHDLMQTLSSFSGDTAQGDDLTFLILRYTGK
jgi:serine phosphatase RsbU (regulator of sigma subunit)